MDFSLVAWNLTVFAISNQDEVEVNGVTASLFLAEDH